MKLHIAENFTLPLDAVTQTFAILAKRGVGKTYLALVLVEELLKAGAQVVLGDPVGVCWGLRAAANGRDPGLPIIVMGGDHGDVPLEAGAGKVVAEFVVETRSSVVLDLSLLRKGDQVRFMTDFAETLYHRNRAPLHLVLDEADAFAPQRPMHGQERMLGAIQDLVRRGRARGIGVTLVTQRAAVLSKDVLTQAEVLVALRTIAPQDREAIDAWIQAHDAHGQRAEFMASLASLPIGTAWFWSPGWLDVFRMVRIRTRETFDSSATPTVGHKAKAPKRLAPVDLAALTKQIAATIEKAKAEDPKELRAKIHQLEADNRKLQTSFRPPPVTEVELVRVNVPILTERDIARLAKLADRMNQGLQAVITEVGIFNTLLKQASLPHPCAAIPPTTQKPFPPKVGVQAREVLHNGLLSGGLSRILIALAQRPQGLSAKQVGVRAGLSSSSGTFGTYLGKARSQGWVEGDRSLLTLTMEGLNALGGYEPLPAGPALLEYWLRELGQSGAARLLQALASVYPRSLSKDQAASMAGLSPSSGTFGTYLGKLRTLELVTGRTELQASGELFE